MKFASMLRRLRNTQGGMGSTSSSSYTPYVDPPDDPFGVDAGDAQMVSRGDRVQFTGTVSNAPEGVTLTYTWAFGDGATDAEDVNGLMPSCVYNTLGERTVRLTVSYTDTNGDLVEVFDEVIITVVEVVGPPTIVEPLFEVDAGDPQTVSVGDRVQFEGTVSNAPEGATLNSAWTFRDGATSINVNKLMATCIFVTRGEKTVRLTVRYTADGKTVEASDNVIITVIKPLMPWCTSELPAEPPAVIELAPVPPSLPDYAVSTAYVPQLDISPIPLQAERPLNELEKAAIDLVFKDSPSFSPTMLANTVRVKVENEGLTPDGDSKRGDQANGIITIYRGYFRWGDAIDANSTVGNTDIFKPGNLDFLNTFMHEAAHWWQEHQNRYRIHLPPSEIESTTDPKRYDFDYDQLRDLAFDDKEAHASAVATWFIIAWQLEHRPVDQLINVTNRGVFGRFHVGTLTRYSEIAKINFLGNRATSPPLGTWITRADAEQLACHFKPLIEEIQTAQPLPASG